MDFLMPTLAIKREVLRTASRIYSRHAPYLKLFFTTAAGEMLAIERSGEFSTWQRYQASTGLYRALLFLRGIQTSEAAANSSDWPGPLPKNLWKKLQTEDCNKKPPMVHCRHISTSHHIWAVCTAQFKLQGSFSLPPLPQDWWLLLAAVTRPLVCIRFPYIRKNAFLTAWAGFCFTWRKSSNKKSSETPWPEL